MQILKKILQNAKSLALFEFIAGYRALLGGVMLMYSGLLGLVFGAIPVPTGVEGMSWTEISPEQAWTMLSNGIGIIGLRKAIK